MKTEKNNEIIISSLPRLGLLIGAILPITENKDWLFYPCVILITLSFLIFIAGSIIICNKDHKKVLTTIWGNSRDTLFDVFISIAGIIICYSTGFLNQVYFWWFVLIASIFMILFPNKKQEEI
jgi:hypothetical protein